MEETPLEVGDVVMCTVEKIAGTVVFVKIDENGEGSIVLSEIAPGRIRNLRDYVIPKKRIICKIIRITGDRIDLSLRRVTPKEQKEVKEKYELEKSYKSILTGILGEKAAEAIAKIRKKGKIFDFIQEAKNSPSMLEEIMEKKDAQKVLEIINSHKPKKITIKKEIGLTTNDPDGIEIIKKILKSIKDAEIKYISAGRYSIKVESEDPKTADHSLTESLKELEKKSKSLNVRFSLKEI